MVSKNISAIVVLYNPEDDIYENILSYAHDVQNLIVVDNSTNHNVTLIEKLQNEFPHLIYINNNENLGIATALNIGCDKAIELGSNWALTMDQDSKFINFKDYLTCLSQLQESNHIALLAANTNWNETLEINKEQLCNNHEVFSAITSANLLNLKNFDTIGKFEDKLFIDLVDYDYCLKAQKNKLKILYFPNIYVKHNLGTVFQRKNLITGKIRNKVEHNPQRTYYFARNYLYVSSKYSSLFPKELSILKAINILFIHEVTKILLYEDQKRAKLKAKFLGLIHFLRNSYGKYDLKDSN